MKEKLHPDSQDQNQIAKERTLMAWRLFEDLLNSTERTIINTSGKAINDLFNNTPLPLIEGA